MLVALPCFASFRAPSEGRGRGHGVDNIWTKGGDVLQDAGYRKIILGSLTERDNQRHPNPGLNP